MKTSTTIAVTEFVRLVGGTTWTRIESRCTGKWRGTTDYGILIDNRVKLYVSNGMTGFESRIREWIGRIKTFRTKKDEYLQKIREQAQWDNASAQAEGLHPVKVLDIGIVSPEATDEYFFFLPYALLEVDGRQFKHSETNFAAFIGHDSLDTWLEKAKRTVSTAAGTHTPDYIFGGIRYDSHDTQYTIR